MFEVNVAYMRGFGLGFNYSNEDIEGIETIADDLRHTIQVTVSYTHLRAHET